MAPVILDRIRESLEDRLGYSELRGTLAETTEELALLRNEAEELGYRTLDYFSGSPQELRKETRHRITQRSRVAFMEDPIAGAEAEHLGNFSLSRGIGRPRAKDKAVQAIIDEAWDDAGNQEVLTSYEALRAISNELKAGANLFPVGYVKNGKVRIGFLNADLVQNIIPDEDNRLRPLWYMVKESTSSWDFVADRVLVPEIGNVAKVKYYPHWRNVEVINAERKENGDSPLTKPPADKLGDGLVYHVRINRLLEQRFGTPPWNRTLRYFSAMARLTEARVNMALAASSFIAKRVIRGGPSEVIKQAQTLIQQTGEIGAQIPKAREALTGQQTPPRPGSFLTENDGHSLQALSLNSGSGAAVVDAQIVRAAATAPSGFGQHYFGDSSNSNLASAACHDELTETLTEEGWLTYDQLRQRDADDTLPRIAGFDSETHQVSYHYPLQKMLQYDYDGELIHFLNSRNDVMVTPDHRMFIQRKNGEWCFREAQDVQGGGTLKAGLPVSGVRQETFTLPSCLLRTTRSRVPDAETIQRIEVVASTGRQRTARTVPDGFCACGCGGSTSISPRNRWDGERLVIAKGERYRILPGHAPKPLNMKRIAALAGASMPEVRIALSSEKPRARSWLPEMTLAMDPFLDWLGWYIAEGSGGGVVAQAENSPWLLSLQDACRGLGVPGREYWKGGGDLNKKGEPKPRIWNWCPRNFKQWEHWLYEYCGRGASNKKIPAFVFLLPADQQIRVLRGLMHGDGACGADDLWETRGSSVFGSSSPQLLDDVQRLATNCGFRATRTRSGVSLVAVAQLSPVQHQRGHVAQIPAGRRVGYRGRVYCFTLPTDTMITRRNGHVAFHGNTLELPALMMVGAWQETLEQLLRWFIDLVIQEAVRAGRLGGSVKDPEATDDGKALSELRLSEAEDKATAEKRTGKDLTYSFQMPYPGRRNLAEVVAAFVEVMTQLSPIGENEELSKIMLEFLFTHGLQLEDAAGVAEAVEAAQQKLIKSQAEQAATQAQAQNAMMATQAEQQGQMRAAVAQGRSSGQAAQNNGPDTQQSQYGEGRKTAQPRGDGTMEALAEGSWLPDGSDAEIETLMGRISVIMQQGVTEPAVRAAASLNGSH